MHWENISIQTISIDGSEIGALIINSDNILENNPIITIRKAENAIEKRATQVLHPICSDTLKRPY